MEACSRASMRCCAAVRRGSSGSRSARSRSTGSPAGSSRTGRRSSSRRRSSRCSSSSRPIPTASSRVSSCCATSGASGRTCRRGRWSHTRPGSAASSRPPAYPAGSWTYGVSATSSATSRRRA